MSELSLVQSVAEPIPMVKFFDHLWGIAPDGYINFRFISESGGRPTELFREVNELKLTEQALAWLAQQNKSFHIYHRVNLSSSASGKKDALRWGVALWVDIDNQTDINVFDQAYYPNIIVRSGGGLHGYWLLDEPYPLYNADARKEFEQVLEAMALVYKGDPKVKDASRILRTPDTKNIKAKYGDEKPVARAFLVDDLRYTFSSLKREFSPFIRQEKPIVAPSLPDWKPSTGDKRLPNYVEEFLKYGAPQGERNQRLFVCARFYLDNGFSQFDAEQDLLSKAVSIGLTQAEAKATITSAFRQARGQSVGERQRNTRTRFK